jgi:hypothetical protein
MKNWKINDFAKIKGTELMGRITDIKNNKYLLSYKDKNHSNAQQWVEAKNLKLIF